MAQPVIPFPGELLQRGASGPLVRRLQERLRLEPTASFGPTTEQLVRDWQRAHGLEADGVVGPLTHTLLYDLGTCIVDVARSYVGQREQSTNRSPLIDRWNHEAGALPGSPWCVSFAYACVREACVLLRIPCVLVKTASSSALYRWARDMGRLTREPNPGDLGIVRGGPTGHAHTFVIVGQPHRGRVATVEGNSNSDGSHAGVEVAFRSPGRLIDTCDFVRM